MSAARADRDGRRALRPWALSAIGAGLFVLFAGFCALGAWQIQRLGWKRELIARVDGRIHAAPVAAPARPDWPNVGRARDEYRRVAVDGEYVAGRDTRVQALTGLGAGHWQLTPLRRDDGDVVLVNRGFVPDGETAAPPPSGRVRVVGLLRIDEPGGGFLRANDPAHDRWYSRDVAAIAQARGLDVVAPYFVDAGFIDAGLADAERAANADMPHWPAAGMTVVRFRNHHLAYAATWFALAGLVGFAAWRVMRSERRLRQHGRLRTNTAQRDAGPTTRRE